ncbi:MAG: protease modulator HflK [Gemmataceae bacterium]
MIRWLLGALFLVLFFITAATSLTQVQPGQRLVVRRFGRILPDTPGPGLHIGLPWGIDRVEAVAVNTERAVVLGYRPSPDERDDVMPPGQLLTGDHNLVNVQAEVRYTVRDTEAARYVLHKDRVDAVIARTAEAILAEWVAGQPVDEVLLKGQHALRRRLLDELPGRLEPYELGIRIEDASLQPLFPPDRVREFFEAVNQAETAIETKKNQARERADTRLSEAKAEQYSLERLADAYATEKRFEARADADRFRTALAQYRLIKAKNENYLDVLWLDEMTRLYVKMGEAGRVDLLDNVMDKGGLNVFMSPLPKKK